MIWTIPPNDGPKEKIFDNDAAWRALELACRTMHEYDLKRDKYVVAYVNGDEIKITEGNALEIIFSYKPKVVLVFLKTSAVGKGMRGMQPLLTCRCTYDQGN
jgi:hypothetical protein